MTFLELVLRNTICYMLEYSALPRLQLCQDFRLIMAEVKVEGM